MHRNALHTPPTNKCTHLACLAPPCTFGNAQPLGHPLSICAVQPQLLGVWRGRGIVAENAGASSFTSQAMPIQHLDAMEDRKHIQHWSQSGSIRLHHQTIKNAIPHRTIMQKILAKTMNLLQHAFTVQNGSIFGGCCEHPASNYLAAR